MLKKVLSSILFFTLMLNLTYTVYAATAQTSTTWANKVADGQDFVPATGVLTAVYYSGDANNDPYATTKLSFTYTSACVSDVIAYNADGLYTGMDIKSYRPGKAPMMDGYSITTSLPNPKTDLESNNPLGNAQDEADVVALGTIVANKSYTMTVQWWDKRDGLSGSNGDWVVNAELSKKGIFDYNTQRYLGLASLAYGISPGKV